ncbi:hypothetical protein G7Y89_g2888 [Cudoniella acicularis]|uniref:Nucleotide sugar dehydrogenase n=1 Tax=Cudoniella acicularis TaxID=354080 RepID=A0A8H4RTM1_9HELO|nr:hypothetical protein G7Y89_g2888 [Cudoniella acicularis]
MSTGLMIERRRGSQSLCDYSQHYDEFERRLSIVSSPKQTSQCRQQEIYLRKDSKDPVVAVIGVGYVGFQLVEAFSKHYPVIAFDASVGRVATIQKQLKGIHSVTCTSDESTLSRATHFLLAVPTPLLPNRQIDTSCLQSAISTIGTYARPGATVVIESSVSVGMTRALMAPLTVCRGFKAGMSPERVDPGRSDPPFENIPKIISGLDDICPGSLESIHRLYSKVFKSLVSVSKPEVAEMTKLYENCQRMMAIAYTNEMADACVGHGIDPFEVSKAAGTKPFGYLPITPSLGVGGHCIPVNPYYLFSNNSFPLLEAATEKMRLRPSAVGDRIMKDILKQNPSHFLKRKARVLVVGVAFKPGQTLVTGSPAVALMQHLLSHWKVYVAFADPLVQESALPFVPRFDERKEWSKSKLEWFDAIIVAVRQPGINYALLDNLDHVRVEIWN